MGIIKLECVNITKVRERERKGEKTHQGGRHSDWKGKEMKIKKIKKKIIEGGQEMKQKSQTALIREEQQL